MKGAYENERTVCKTGNKGNVKLENMDDFAATLRYAFLSAKARPGFHRRTGGL